MKIQTTVDAVSKALVATGAVATGTAGPFPILGCALFSGEKDGEFATSLVTNMSVTASARIPAKVLVPGKVAIPVAELLSILKNSEKDADLEIGDIGGRVLIECDNTDAKILTMPATDFPDTVMPKADGPRVKVKTSTKALKQKLSFVKFAIAKGNEARKILLGVLFQSESNGVIDFVATDGKKLASCRLRCDGGESSVPEGVKHVASEGFVSALLAALGAEKDDGDVRLEFDERSASVETASGFVLTAQGIEGKYPNVVGDVIPKQTPVSYSFNGPAMVRALKKAMSVANDMNRTIQLTVDPEKKSIVVSGTSYDKGVVETRVECANTSLDAVYKTGFNAAYLVEVLTTACAFGAETVTAECKDANGPCLFNRDSESTLLLMPIKLSKQPNDTEKGEDA